MEKHVKALCIDLHKSFLLGDHAFVNKVAGDLYSSGSGTLTVTGLEHVKLAMLDGELHVLHISVVVLKGLADLLELLESLRELVLHFGYRHRGTNACNNVLALCVGEEFSHESLFAGRRITGKCNTGSAIVAHIAERHHLYVDSGTP